MNHVDHATVAAWIADVDQAVRAHEDEWGIGRLESLADADLRAKLYRQQAKHRAALEAAYATPDTRPAPDVVMADAFETGEGVKRGWAFLARQALADGHKPSVRYLGEVQLKNGSVAVLVASVADASLALRNPRYEHVFTLDEIGRLIDAVTEPRVASAAPVVVRERVDTSWVKEGDALPF